ncbi:MAG: S4 domain-containing protein [Bacteroidota bacterium]
MSTKSPRFLQLSKARNAGPLPRIPTEWVEGKPMRLNKYLAHAGLADRRTCENYIKGGQIQVNGELVKNPGHKVSPTDQVTRWNKPLATRLGLAYALANRAAGIEEENLGRLLQHPDLAHIEWQSVFLRPSSVSGLSLLTNDELMIARLRENAHRYKSTLTLESSNARELSLAQLENFSPEGGQASNADLIRLLSFDKKDLPRGFYRFLREEEIGWLRKG